MRVVVGWVVVVLVLVVAPLVVPLDVLLGLLGAVLVFGGGLGLRWRNRRRDQV